MLVSFGTCFSVPGHHSVNERTVFAQKSLQSRGNALRYLA